jgi:hypothetical protein
VSEAGCDATIGVRKRLLWMTFLIAENAVQDFVGEEFITQSDV